MVLALAIHFHNLNRKVKDQNASEVFEPEMNVVVVSLLESQKVIVSPNLIISPKVIISTFGLG